MQKFSFSVNYSVIVFCKAKKVGNKRKQITTKTKQKNPHKNNAKKQLFFLTIYFYVVIISA